MRRSYREKTNDKYDRDLFGLGLFISIMVALNRTRFVARSYKKERNDGKND